jgi:MFS transporter, ACS family, hexuronate transporter
MANVKTAAVEPPQTPSSGTLVNAVPRFRWVICGLLLFATTINYMDRQVIGYLKEFFCSPVSSGGFGWSNADFANVTSAFTAMYAGTSIFAGALIDRIGTKLGLALSLIVWSFFGFVNGFAGPTVGAHVVLRALFGIGEAGNFPASIRTVAEWFPKRERAVATAVFNSGANLGAMLAAIFVPYCLITFGDQRGWRAAFILTGAAGLVWLVFWFWLYDPPDKHKRLSKAEYEYVQIDEERSAGGGSAPDPESAAVGRAKVPWRRLFSYRQTWAFFVGKLLTDGVWWFYLFWLPDYLKKQFGMTKQQVMLPTFIVYGVSIVGSIYGGSIPMTLMRRGMGVYQARMTAMLAISLLPVSVLFTQYLGDVNRFGGMASVLATGTICIGAAAHQAWSANLFTTVSDMFPKKAVSSVTGIGAMGGGLGGVIIQVVAGQLTDTFKSDPKVAYLIMFVVCALSYVLAWLLMKTLVPRQKAITDL